MLNRRGILRMISGGLAAGAAVDPKAVIREAARGGMATGAVLASGNAGAATPGVEDPEFRAVDRMLTGLYDHLNAVEASFHRVPAHIASKKSWSPVFKQSEAYKEAMVEANARRELERNSELARTIAKQLGFL